MLDQLDQMQVTIPIRTRSFPVSSYAIGPIDPAQTVTLQARLTVGQDISLVVPVHLPHTVLADPAFKDGYEWGYTEEGLGFTSLSVPKMLNEICRTLQLHEELAEDDDPDDCPWVIGFLFGALALTGVAHLWFLLSFLPLDPLSWPPYRLTLTDLDAEHTSAMRAYRAQVRLYRVQGKSYDEAQRLALTNQERSVLSC